MRKHWISIIARITCVIMVIAGLSILGTVLSTKFSTTVRWGGYQTEMTIIAYVIIYLAISFAFPTRRKKTRR